MDCKSGDITQPEVSINWLQTNIADLSSYYREWLIDVDLLLHNSETEDDNKLLKRGKNALRSGHPESCLYNSTSGVINGKRKNLQRSRKHRWLQSAEKHILIFFFIFAEI